MAESQVTLTDGAADRRREEPYSGRTAWARNLAAPVRDFLRTETGGAAVLLVATLAALAWANSPWSDSYQSVWTSKLSIRLGSHALTTDLRHWVNEGLMTFFFLVVGLEAKREFDLGELRERRRLAIPVMAAVGGMALPVAIYEAFNAGGAGAHGWGAAMSTDTALALGALALLTPRSATRLRVVDAILSGTHAPGTSHYNLLRAFVNDATLLGLDRELKLHDYRTHEFGDSVFIERIGRGTESLEQQSPAA